ncbi:MAG TPA: hypothetical protein VJR46_09040 [Candidatus Dormibacteraeota bacterium]|nr:hypothetical protein [Candidatus Dormibacteraeota bacterium]
MASAGADLVLLGRPGEYGAQSIYDVTDPVHPRLLCKLTNSSADLKGLANFTYVNPESASKTDLIVHTYAEGTESTQVQIPAWTNTVAFAPSGMVAYTIPVNYSAGFPPGGVQVWLAPQERTLPTAHLPDRHR